MEEKILRVLSITIVLFCIVLAAMSEPVINWANSFQEKLETAREEKKLRGEREEYLLGMTGLEYLQTVTDSLIANKSDELEDLEPEVITQLAVLPFDSQLRIELPEGVSLDNLNINSDYMNKIISYRVPGFDGGYLIDYPMLGSANHIDEITYSADDEGLLVEFRMDGIYEPDYSTDGHYVFLDFLNPREKYDYLVVVDAGHGGDMPGAIRSGIMEKDIDLAIVKELKELLDENNKKIGVFYTRTTDCNPDFADRIGIANELDADLFLSVHINSLNNTSTHGSLVMYNQKAKKKKRLASEQAQIMLESLVDELGSASRGTVDGSDIYVLHHAKVPAVLVEVGFISNATERALLISSDYQKKCAKALYKGIKKSLEIK